MGKQTFTTFSGQGTLKPLPVPPLDATLSGLIEVIQPLVSSVEMQEIMKLVTDFGANQGKELQALLEQKAALLQNSKIPPPFESTETHPDGSNFPDNHWLERWWETYAYLSDRTPLAVNINCFQTHFGGSTCDKPTLRAAWMAKGSMDARRLLLEEAVPPEYVGTQLMCSAQYLRVFSTTRLPGATVDEIHSFRDSTHVCVTRRNHWYVVENAPELSVMEWEEAFRFIINDADKRPVGPNVSVFTGIDRTKWHTIRERLLLSPRNAETIRLIESAITHFSLSEAKPTSPAALQELGQSGNNGGLWFDKSSTNIICDNGASVSNLEHCSADAVVPARIFLYADEFVQKNAPEVGFPKGMAYKEGLSKIPITSGVAYHEITNVSGNIRSNPKLIEFVLDELSVHDLLKAKEDLKSTVDDNIVDAMDFRDFGSKDILEKCKGVSVDSFMQIALALAYYRDQGEMPVTYETASTRLYFHGRTDCIRVQSIAMKRFLEDFDQQDPTPSELERLAGLFREAATHHRNFTKRCMAGQGIDRHLFGLRLTAMEKGMKLHPLFDHPSMQKMNTFTLSTSQMPWACLDWPGFGAYGPKSYGVCYRFTCANTIVATVTSRRHTGQGRDARRFSEVIKTALRDCMKLMSAHPGSKL